MSAVRDHIARGENRKRGGIYLIFQDIYVFNNVFLFQRPFRMIFVKDDNKKRIVQIDIQICMCNPPETSSILPFIHFFQKLFRFSRGFGVHLRSFFIVSILKEIQTKPYYVVSILLDLSYRLFKRYCVCVFFKYILFQTRSLSVQS